MDKRLAGILDILGEKVINQINSYGFMPDSIREIRLIAEKPVFFIIENKIKKIENTKISSDDVRNIFASFCEYSLHTYQDEIREGFITANGGIRIGICGTAVYENEKLVFIKDISALNIRIPHEIKGISKPIELFYDEGILIIGPPCSGKTTLLRDFARCASKKRKVTIVDERTEISGTFHGVPSFDIGYSTVLNGFLKNEGITMAVRSMSPETIVCDEFGGRSDIESALYAMKSGVKIVASIHASDKNDFIGKPFVKDLIKYKIFKYFVFLNKNCEIYEIHQAEDILL